MVTTFRRGAVAPAAFARMRLTTFFACSTIPGLFRIRLGNSIPRASRWRLRRTGGVRRLLVERHPVFHASLHELRPVRHRRNGVGLLRQESPERRMMPAELVPRAVAMPPDAGPQLPDFDDELVAGHRGEVFV